jgi:hypothetical protein
MEGNTMRGETNRWNRGRGTRAAMNPTHNESEAAHLGLKPPPLCGMYLAFSRGTEVAALPSPSIVEEEIGRSHT